jgi:hypothetical protein
MSRRLGYDKVEVRKIARMWIVRCKIEGLSVFQETKRKLSDGGLGSGLG